MMLSWETIRLLLVLAAMLLLPGWAMLALSDLWRRWGGLQRWIVAVGLSIAVYPVLFYSLRFVAPWFTLGPYKMSAGLLLCFGVIVWRMRDTWREQFAWDYLEWAALAIFGMTLFTRFWIIRDQPYPAWTDSLHHTLLTQLTAVQGQLPISLEPYFPIPLDQYHLGLYALTATTQWLAQVPAHTALLWTAQALNGLCGLGVYLVLDRRVGRVGALVGAATVGLWSHQPAWYVNWGRFTQVAAQTLVLIAWDVLWDATSDWRRDSSSYWAIGSAAVLSAGIFLLHFRVAVLYVVLCAVGFSVDIWALSGAQRRRALIAGAITVALTLVLVASALWPAGRFYWVSTREAQTLTLSPELIEATRKAYFSLTWESVPHLVARSGLLITSGASAIICLWRRMSLAAIQLAWLGISVALGFAYLLDVPLLAFTNIGMVLVGLYMPLSVMIGAGAEVLVGFSTFGWLRAPAGVVLGTWLCLASSHIRVSEIELYRYFVTPEDVAAMHWINAHLPETAHFAVNTYFWMPRAPHGTDAGYWIPYFTGRRTSAGAMLNNLGSLAYQNEVVVTSQAVAAMAMNELHAAGITHIYLGARGNFAEPALDRSVLLTSPEAQLVYESHHVAIFALVSAE